MYTKYLCPISAISPMQCFYGPRITLVVSKCLYTGLALCPFYIGRLYTGLENQHSVLLTFCSVLCSITKSVSVHLYDIIVLSDM